MLGYGQDKTQHAADISAAHMDDISRPRRRLSPRRSAQWGSQGRGALFATASTLAARGMSPTRPRPCRSSATAEKRTFDAKRMHSPLIQAIKSVDAAENPSSEEVRS